MGDKVFSENDYCPKATVNKWLSEQQSKPERTFLVLKNLYSINLKRRKMFIIINVIVNNLDKS